MAGTCEDRSSCRDRYCGGVRSGVFEPSPLLTSEAQTPYPLLCHPGGRITPSTIDQNYDYPIPEEYTGSIMGVSETSNLGVLYPMKLSNPAIARAWEEKKKAGNSRTKGMKVIFLISTKLD